MIGVGALWSYLKVTANSLNVPRLEVLDGMKIETYDSSSCPLCANNVPTNTEVGHGREFLAK